MHPSAILETVLYAEDLGAARAFYGGALGLPEVAAEGNRHVFFRCGASMLLVFNPNETIVPPAAGKLPVPPHGCRGPGHLCFRASAAELADWRARLERIGVAIEADFAWPQGGRSIYFRDPAGNSLEFAEPRIWGLPLLPRLAPGSRLVVASHNAGKVTEIADLLSPFGLDVVSAGELALPEPEETGATFVENAVLKAEAAARGAGLPALADDSGLSIDSLAGEPGIMSARWAGPSRDFSAAMRLVEEKLQAKGATAPADRRAHFVCALCLALPDGSRAAFEGRVDGALVWPPRGDRGFGYDPMFLPDGFTLTFGEMEPHAKHAISHRARAFRALVEDVFERD
jgi:XTP/dITP diphosphohydrolase